MFITKGKYPMVSGPGTCDYKPGANPSPAAAVTGLSKRLEPIGKPMNPLPLSSLALPTLPDTIGGAVSPDTPPESPDSTASAWRFSVVCPRAEQVMLVRQDEQGLSSWLPMSASDAATGRWELTVPMDRLAGLFRYYTVEGGAVINGGTAGLAATRLGSATASA